MTDTTAQQSGPRIVPPEYCPAVHFLGLLCGREPGHDGFHAGVIPWIRHYDEFARWDDSANGRVVICENIGQGVTE